MENNINKNTEECAPIGSIVSEHAYEAFICKTYPKSCHYCPFGYYSRCNIDSDMKTASEKNKKRPSNCPLITPTYLYDYQHNVKFVCLNESEWTTHNPILIPGAIAIVGDKSNNGYPLCIKIGDGESKYTDLIYQPLHIQNKSDNNDDYTKINTDRQIQFSAQELVKLITTCNIAINTEENTIKLHPDNNNLVESCTNAINQITKIKDKIKQAIVDDNQENRNNQIKNYKGGLDDSSVNKVKVALNVIKSMWVPQTGGFIDHINQGNKSYQYINFICRKKECLDALDIIKEFIEEFAPDIDDND